MNLCVDCEHYGRGEFGVVEVCLLHPAEPETISPVDGWATWPKHTREFRRGNYYTCDYQRDLFPDCPEFEEPPRRWWQFWRKRVTP